MTNKISVEGLSPEQIKEIEAIINEKQESNIKYRNKSERLKEYRRDLSNQELATNSIDKYMRDAKELETFLADRDFSKDLIIEYKDIIKNGRGYKTSTANNKIISINKYLGFLGLDDMKVKNIKIQEPQADTLTDNEYMRVLKQANIKGTPRDVLMLELLYNTGIRVSEMLFFTVESVKAGAMQIENKGKIRQIPINNRLSKQAKKYIKSEGIEKGAIILTSKGNPLSRGAVYSRIQYLGGQARGIKKSKLHPHSIRSLFAKNYLAKPGNSDIQLANILGHSSLETTRRYTHLDINETKKTMEF